MKTLFRFLLIAFLLSAPSMLFSESGDRGLPNGGEVATGLDKFLATTSSSSRVTFLNDVYGAGGALISDSSIQESDGFEMVFKVKFDAHFNFEQEGGPIGWGLKIGDGADGFANGLGGSFCLAWDTDANGNSFFKPYIFYADQPGTSGHDFGVRYPTKGSIEGNVWYTVKMVFKANTNIDRNGRAQLYVNNVQVLNTPIRWTKDHSRRKAHQLIFSNNHSGAGGESSFNTTVWFKDLTLARTTPTYAPTWCDSVYTVTDHFDEISATTYYLTEIDGSKSKLQIALAGKKEGETGTEFSRRMDCCVAFNASLGIKNLPPNERRPIGIQIIHGNILQDLSTKRHTLGIKDQNQLVSYPPDKKAKDIVADGTRNALTAFTPLIQDHQTVPESILGTVPGYLAKHPRQVIAQYDNGNFLVLSCGGRSFEGEGMTAADVIRILSALDVRFAFMLDGGGSVTTMLNGQRITPMIDNGGTIERPRPNWLYVKYNHGD